MAPKKIDFKKKASNVEKSKAGTGTQISAASTPQSRPPLNALVGKENAQMHQQPQSDSSTFSREGPEAMMAVFKRLEEMEAHFAKEQEEKRKLEAIIKTLRAEAKEGADADHSIDEEMVPRPAGTVSKDWSLQIEMGLSGSSNKVAKYQALLRGMRDLVLNAGLKWEVGWKEIPAAEKSKLFQVARERYPILKRYVNDWAMVEMVKQYIKNKRGHHYNNGWLAVPEKYSYLKENAKKHDPSGSRVKRAKVDMAAKKKAKHDEKLEARNRKKGLGKAAAEMDEESKPEESEGSENEADNQMEN